MTRNILFVAIGGMLGSVLRYLLSTLMVGLLPYPFPFGTFVVNLIGCFVMGATVSYAERSLWFNQEWRIFITVGLCGGFTTFSAFALENITLLLDKNYLAFAAYVFASVVLGTGAALAGFLLVRS